MTETPKPPARLIIQTNMPCGCIEDAETWYEDIKIFLKAINPNVQINGQIIKMLEPCCKEKKTNEQNTKAL